MGLDLRSRLECFGRSIQILLALRGHPDGEEASVRQLAERLFIQHHSAVGLIDRLEARGYVRRDRSRGD
jgi:DNA-binding MarR family transcriptional regulator